MLFKQDLLLIMNLRACHKVGSNNIFMLFKEDLLLILSQVWYVGPIALKAGEAPYGGDVGFELGAAFAASSYLLFRTIEKRIFKR